MILRPVLSWASHTVHCLDPVRLFLPSLAPVPVHFTLWPQGASPSPWTHIPSPDLSHTYGPLCWESPGPPRTTSFCPLASLLLAKDLFILQDLVQISSLEIFLFSIIALKLLYSHLSVYLTLSCLLPPPGWISCFKAGQTQYLGLYTVTPNTASSTQRKCLCWLDELECVCMHTCDKGILCILSKANKSDHKTSIWWGAQLVHFAYIYHCTYYKSITVMCFYESYDNIILEFRDLSLFICHFYNLA